MKEEILKNKQCFDEYIMVMPGSDYGRAMWQDIGELNNATLFESAISSGNKALSLVHHIHFSFGINNKVQLPFQHIWKNYYSLNSIEWDNKKKYCVIFSDVSAGRTDKKYLDELHKKDNIRLVLVNVNNVSRKKNIIESRLDYFDLIFSFDRKDAEKYGFIYYPTLYSIQKIKNGIPEYDAFFVGVAKDRLNMLHEIYNIITAAGGRAEFFISGVKKKDCKYSDIHYNEWLNYTQILEYIQKSKCLIEVMGGEQDGVTLRAMEAICYDKKLITNNRSVQNLSFYRTGFIQTFKEANDINTDFIINNDRVDFHYNNEFSPIHLIDRINYEEMK